ncbi:MAG TPA: hypothetical protein VD866_05485 [Urbifossiella sp.]|nr:hypothetical protein [Urbifossiella sp.]
MTRRSRLGRHRTLVDAAVNTATAPPAEVWLPLKDGGNEVPGRYPHPGGCMVLVLYDPNDPAAAEEPV